MAAERANALVAGLSSISAASMIASVTVNVMPLRSTSSPAMTRSIRSKPALAGLVGHRRFVFDDRYPHSRGYRTARFHLKEPLGWLQDRRIEKTVATKFDGGASNLHGI